MKHLSLDEWNKHVGRHLEQMRIDAGWLEYYVKSIGRRVDAMSHAPEWESEAIHETDRMIKLLLNAAAKLQDTVFKYHQKEKVS